MKFIRLAAQLTATTCAAALSAPTLAQESGASGASSASVEDIVVTATRNEQTISKVPISITALSQERMDQQGFRTFADIARTTPGVQFAPESGEIVIRGIDGSNAGAGTVGIYIDDTPIQSRAFGYLTTNAAPLLFDLERVEVLRGPQGTLFGAGAQGGAVRYITPQPSLSSLDVYARAEANSVKGGGIGGELGIAIGAPIVEDKLGFRVSAYYRHVGGYVDRVHHRTDALLDKNSNSEDGWVLRGALAFKPTETITITPSILYTQRDVNDTKAFVVALSDPSRGIFRSGQLSPSFQKERYILPSLNVRIETDFADIIYNGSYFKRDQEQNDDLTNLIANFFGASDARGANVPGIPGYFNFTDVPNKQRNWTHELRLQSVDSDARFTWIAGVFYQKNKQFNREDIHDPQFAAFTTAVTGVATPPPLLPPDFSFISLNNSSDRQLSVFGELNFKLSDKLTLTGGARYSRTKFWFEREANGYYNGGFSRDTGRAKENPFTPKVSLSYQADERNLFYATAAKGFRIGGATPLVPEDGFCGPDLAALGFEDQPATYKSDTVWNYEVGSKNSFFGNRVRLATSAYMIEWKDIQREISLPTCAFVFTTNIGAARSTGFDLQADVRVTPALNVGFLVGHTNARYTESAAGATRPNGTIPVIVAKGDKINVPTWTATVTADYKFQLFNRENYLRADYAYTGPTRGDTTQQNPQATVFDPNFYERPAIHYVTARVGTKLGKFDVSLFVNNLFNTRRLLTRTHTAVSSPTFNATINPPRTVGVTLISRQ